LVIYDTSLIPDFIALVTVKSNSKKPRIEGKQAEAKIEDTIPWAESEM
jgi:hypothetical protein